MGRALVLAVLVLAAGCVRKAPPQRVGILATTQAAADYLVWAAGDAVAVAAVAGADEDPFRDRPDASRWAQGRWQAALSLGTAWEEPLLSAAGAASPGIQQIRLPLPLITAQGGDAYWLNPIYAERLLGNAGQAVGRLLPHRAEEIMERVARLQADLEEFNLMVRIYKGPEVEMPALPLRVATWSRLPIDFVLYAGYTPVRTFVAFPGDGFPGMLAEDLAGESVVPDLIVASEQAPEWLEAEAAALGVEVVRLAVFPGDLDPPAVSPVALVEANWERLRGALLRLARGRSG